jgi:hypothetical protein
MNKSKQSYQAPDDGNAHNVYRPYWKRAHRDWRVWLGVILTVAAMFVYVMSDDLSIRLRSRPPQTPPVSLGK